MAQLKIHTRKPWKPGDPVPTDGTIVTLDGLEIPNLGGIRLEFEIGGFCELHLRMAVDPATLFETQDLAQ